MDQTVLMTNSQHDLPDLYVFRQLNLFFVRSVQLAPIILCRVGGKATANFCSHVAMLPLADTGKMFHWSMACSVGARKHDEAEGMRLMAVQFLPEFGSFDIDQVFIYQQQVELRFPGEFTGFLPAP